MRKYVFPKSMSLWKSSPTSWRLTVYNINTTYSKFQNMQYAHKNASFIDCIETVYFSKDFEKALPKQLPSMNNNHREEKTGF